jgi:hypothetical protein
VVGVNPHLSAFPPMLGRYNLALKQSALAG